MKEERSVNGTSCGERYEQVHVVLAAWGPFPQVCVYVSEIFQSFHWPLILWSGPHGANLINAPQEQRSIFGAKDLFACIAIRCANVSPDKELSCPQDYLRVLEKRTP